MAIKSIIAILVALSLSSALPTCAQTNAKAQIAQRVFADLVRAMGDGRTPPELKLLSDDSEATMRVAFFDPAQNTISLEERAYDLCVAQGPDSLNALASLLAHELAHYYKDHGWVGDFGNGFADLGVGKTLKKLRRNAGKLVEIETEADYFGGLFGYVAGYNTLGITPVLLDAIYAEYELEEQLHGYPALAERREIAARSKRQLAELIPVFAVGQQLLAIGHHAQAGRTFDYIARTFPSREILNNSGVARALQAVALIDGQPFAYPFELDASTRLRQGVSRSGTDARIIQRLLEYARGLFEIAARKDPGYATAYINLACIAALQKQGQQALLYAEHALTLAEQHNNPLTTANALIARGLARLQQDATQTAAARADFAQAHSANPALAELNLNALAGTPWPEQRQTAAAKTPEPLPFAAEEIRKDPDLIVELPGEKDRVFLFAKNTAEWQGLLLDTGESTITFLSTRENYTGATRQQIGLGTASEKNQPRLRPGAPLHRRTPGHLSRLRKTAHRLSQQCRRANHRLDPLRNRRPVLRAFAASGQNTNKTAADPRHRRPRPPRFSQ